MVYALASQLSLSYTIARNLQYYFGLLRDSMCHLFLSTQRGSHQSEVEHCLRTIKPAVLLADTSLIDLLEQNLSPDLSHSTLRIITSAGGSSTMGWLPLSEMMHEKDPTQKASMLAVIDETSVNIDSDIAFVVFTSGTSGLPKACPHNNRTL